MCPELSHLPPDVLLSNQAESITYFYKKKKNLEKFSTLSCSPLCVCVFTVHMFLWHYDSLFITILCAKIGPAVVGNERNNERIQKSFANLKSSH